MASGSSGRNNSGSKAYDFCSDDILCSDEDYGNQESSNGGQSEPAIETKEFHKSRMARTSVFPSSAYSPPEESLNQEMIATVEKTVKKYTDNLMRFLEGISSRLSQLELYCYNLDKSIGEMRSDLVRDLGEADSKLKSLEKHIQEVHRSMQILRDKQELAEAQKELAKLQLAQKESTSSGHSQKSEERASPQASDPKTTESTSDVHSQQLALALPHQVAPQPSLPARPLEQQQQPPVGPLPPIPPPNVTQSQAYYLPSTQIPNPPGPTPQSHGQYLPSNSQYQAPQMQDLSKVPPQPTQPQVNQAPQIQPLPHYQQQQWPQQLPQTGQMPFSGISQPGTSRMEPMPYGYGGDGKPVQPQHPPLQFKPTFGMQPEDGYTPSGPHPMHSQGNTYIMYESDGGRTHLSPHLPHGGYPPTTIARQDLQPNASNTGPHLPHGGYPPTTIARQDLQPNASNTMFRPSLVRNHPYNDMIEKLVSMGYRGDHVLGLIKRMEESGQPVDFNAVLDRLNGHFSGGAQRGWSE